ncbi:histidinol-phosphate transaminase [Fusibacillus kribbianus]|uniref:Histidinol-phosphate aminotransferase n=1 Tax=Fusibacillus kribbianus TaxID=3044208 RepID=A0AAP4BB19_9FIRM|nr:histidinol-phosphate transaminase [Ruminococcus sp. YH-rum2234]MDI9241608.1 histidinol-phosphate transaminase [Ruminococcus sp. YH-rum2234]
MRPWEDNIRKVVPYVPGEQPKKKNMIKLNTNENPYPPAPGVEEAMKSLDTDRFRLYPDPAADVLVAALAERYGLEKNQVFVGVGSDDVLAMAFLTFFNSDKPVLFPDISYSFYSVWADLYRIPYERPALDEAFCIRKEDYYKENGGVIFPNPNAPTSLAMGLSDVEDIIAHNQDVVVIVDEAYIDFGGQSALPLLEKYENLLVVQTFSKSRSMAGMRIGYAMGNPALIKALNDVKYSFNSYTMNQTALCLGVEAVKDEVYFRETVGKIKATRERTKERLSALGFVYPEPSANFIFASRPGTDAKALFEALKEKDIYVRYFNVPRIDQYLRITIGTDEQMDKLFEFLKNYLNH